MEAFPQLKSDTSQAILVFAKLTKTNRHSDILPTAHSVTRAQIFAVKELQWFGCTKNEETVSF